MAILVFTACCLNIASNTVREIWATRRLYVSLSVPTYRLGEYIIKTDDFTLWHYLADHKRAMGLTLLCTLFTVGINLYLPFIMRQAIDGLSTDTLTGKDLFSLLLSYLVIAAVSLIFSRYLRKIPLGLAIPMSLLEPYTKDQ